MPTSQKDPAAALTQYREQLKTMVEGEDKAELLQSIARVVEPEINQLGRTFPCPISF